MLLCICNTKSTFEKEFDQILLEMSPSSYIEPGTLWKLQMVPAISL